MIKAACLLMGIALLAWLMQRADLDAVLAQVVAVGATGFAVVLAIYAVEFLCDAVSWQLTVPGMRPSARWAARLYLVRMAGEAYNQITPLGGMGGEPVKALILRRRFAVSYSRSVASLVLAKTTNVIALVIFLALGFALMLTDARIGAQLHLLAGAGLVGLALGVFGFFLAQRLRVTSRLVARLRPSHPRLARTLASVREFDRVLVAFYTTDRPRFVTVLALALLNWVLGAAGVWATLYFMGRPVGFLDAWVVEAMAQMVRAGTFFIPASLGAQEGALMLVMGAISGDTGTGLALAMVRRGRELLWVFAGLAASVPLLGPRTGDNPAAP